MFTNIGPNCSHAQGCHAACTRCRVVGHVTGGNCYALSAAVPEK